MMVVWWYSTNSTKVGVPVRDYREHPECYTFTNLWSAA